MKLIRELNPRINKNGKLIKYSLFYCEYCKKKVEKLHYNGLKYKSCGCSMYKISSESLTKHGDNKRINGKHIPSRLYKIWNGMKQRCYYKNNKKYKNYGEKGIIICDKWLNSYLEFKKWALENGYKDNLTIDRIENNKGYEPLNCRWITQAQQVQNSSKAKLTLPKVHIIRKLLYNKLCNMKELSRIYNISISQIRKIKRNYTWKEVIIYGD